MNDGYENAADAERWQLRVDEAIARDRARRRNESGERSAEFAEYSLAPRLHIREEHASQWRAEIQPRDKYSFLYLEEIGEIEEAASVDTRWEVIRALSEQAERRHWFHVREMTEIPRIVTGIRCRNQVSSQNVRAAAAGNEFGLTPERWEDIVADFEARCVYCGRRRPIVMEHVIPISRGGGTVADNVVPACLSCNTSKSDKDPVEWLADNPDKLLCLIDAVCKAEGLSAG